MYGPGGSAAPTRSPADFCGRTTQEAPTSVHMLKTTSLRPHRPRLPMVDDGAVRVAIRRGAPLRRHRRHHRDAPCWREPSHSGIHPVHPRIDLRDQRGSEHAASTPWRPPGRCCDIRAWGDLCPDDCAPRFGLLRQYGSGEPFTPNGIPLLGERDGQIAWMTTPRI